MNIQQLGYICCWDLRDIDIDHVSLGSLCLKHRIDTRHLPSQRKAKSAFSKAVTSVRNRAKKEQILFGTKPVIDSDSSVVWDVYREFANGGNARTTHNLVQVEFDCKTESINLENPQPASQDDARILDWLQAELSESFQAYLRHNNEDVRSLLSSWMSLNAVPLRKAGGFYFVAKSKGVELKRLSQFVGEMGGSQLKLTRVLVDPSSDDVELYRDAASEGLQAETEKLKEDVGNFVETATTKRSSGTRRRQQQLNELVEKSRDIAGELNIDGSKLLRDFNLMASQLGMKPIEGLPSIRNQKAPVDPYLSALKSVAENLGSRGRS